MKRLYGIVLLIFFFPSVWAQFDVTKIKPLDLFKPLIENGEVAGVVTLLASKEKIISLEAAGYSNLEKKTPMKTDDIFWVASQTKPIVAVAFMMLLEEKNLTLDDTLYKYIPEFKNQKVEIHIDENCSVLRKPKRPVTFRHLLNHTSGLSGDVPVQKNPIDRVLLEDIMPGYAYTHLKQDPGEKEIYSTMGINTIGRLIEIFSGMRFDEFLQKRIFDPLGMKNTTFIPSEAQLVKLATTYTKVGNVLEPRKLGFTHPLSDKNRVAMPFGGLFSTAGDLALFCRMCLSGGELDGRRYLSQKSLDSMLVRHSVSLFGAGWVVYGNGSYGHNGAYNTDMTIFPRSDLVGISLVQVLPSHKCRSILREAIWAEEEKNKR